MTFRFSIVLLFNILPLLELTSQNQHFLVLSKADSARFNKQAFSLSYEAIEGLSAFRDKCRVLGYLECNIDTIFKKDSSDIAHFHLGPQYKWNTLLLKDQQGLCFSRFNEKVKQNKDRPVDYQAFLRVKEDLLRCCANSGYPFATLVVNNKIDATSLCSSFYFDNGNRVYYDSISLKGGLSINESLLAHYLDIKIGDVYSEEKLNLISSKLSDINFINIDSLPRVKIYDERASLDVYLSQKKNSYINGVLGVFPDQNMDNRLKLNGEFSFGVSNVFALGEVFKLDWRAMDNKSQNFEAITSFPVILNNGLGAGAYLNMHRMDTQYFNLNTQLSIGQTNHKNKIEITFGAAFSNILSVDTNRIVSMGQLPEQIDFKTRNIGVILGKNLNSEDIYFDDYLFFELGSRIGIKELNVNQDIVSIAGGGIGLKLQHEYDSLNEQKGHFETNISLKSQLKLFKRIAVNCRFRGEIIQTNKYLLNELFKEGGLASIRGFNEGEIEAHNFTCMNLEIHYGIEPGSSFFIFTDLAYFENKVIQTNQWGLGFGTGLKFKTGQGEFNLVYAYGKRSGDAILWQNAKVHFGYISYF